MKRLPISVMWEMNRWNQILETTEKRVFELVQSRSSGDYVPIKEVVLHALEKIEKASKSKGTVTGYLPDFWILIINCPDCSRQI